MTYRDAAERARQQRERAGLRNDPAVTRTTATAGGNNYRDAAERQMAKNASHQGRGQSYVPDRLDGARHQPARRGTPGWGVSPFEVDRRSSGGAAGSYRPATPARNNADYPFSNNYGGRGSPFSGAMANQRLGNPNLANPGEEAWFMNPILNATDDGGGGFDDRSGMYGFGGGGGGGGGRGRGGGGGGVGGPDMSGYNAAMLQLLGSGMFNAQGNPELEAMIDPAIQADIAASNEAFDGIPAWGANPYETARQTPTPQLDPSMLKLLAANGVPLDGYQADVGAANQQIGAADANWGNYFSGMGAATTEDRAMADRTNASQRAAINSQFGAMGTQMRAALAARKAEEQKQLQQQKMQAIMALISANQGMPGGINLGGLL